MLFIADQMVPNELVSYVRERKHQVLLVREVLVEHASDLVISKLAHDRHGIVITWNIRHFRRFICRAPRGEHIRFRHAGLLGFECHETVAVRRSREVFELIEHEHERSQRMSDKRFFATVRADGLLIER
jgi:hypothetical protein